MPTEKDELELSESDVRKLTKALNKFYDLRDPIKKPDTKVKSEIARIKRKKKKVCFLDSTQISGIHFKNKTLEDWFLMNFEVYHPATAPTIDYTKHKNEAKSMYHIEYMHDLMKIMEVFSEYTTLKIKADYPITLENDYMICWLAPRIETK